MVVMRVIIHRPGSKDLDTAKVQLWRKTPKE
jgi:hypothetical protein